MFNFFKKENDEDIFETVEPVVENRRSEKFSKPLIYDEEFEEEQKKKDVQQVQSVKKEAVKKEAVKKEIRKPVVVEEQKKSYEMMDVISPMFGMSEKEEEKKNKGNTTKPVKKKTKKKDYSLVQVISPFYGNFDDETESAPIEDEAVLTPGEEQVDDAPVVHPVEEVKDDVKEDIKEEPIEKIEDLPTVEDNLRNIAKIVEEEQDQLKIIEERTGEFKLDFGNQSSDSQKTLIDEIDDNMSLDELMSLYEKKFKD